MKFPSLGVRVSKKARFLIKIFITLSELKAELIFYTLTHSNLHKNSEYPSSDTQLWII